MSDAIAVARVFIQNKGPYYTPVLLQLTFQPEKGLGTLATTESGVVYFDPKLVDSLPVPQTAGAIVHEMHHVVREHVPRFRQFPGEDPTRLNYAADFTINPQIIAEGWELPFKVMPSDYKLPDNLTLEEYVALLQGKALPEGEGCGGGKCGGVGGNPLPGEEKIKAPVGKDQQSMADAVKECIRIAATTAPGPHRGWWSSLAATIDVPAKVPWRKVYRGVVSAVSGGISLGCSDYSYARRSRRQLLSQSQLPKMVDHEPEVCVILDTSGSMNDLMSAAVSETRSLLRCLGIAHIWLLQADTKVRSTRRIRLQTLSSVELVGGGGTSFDHALEEAAKLVPRPDFAVYITDGYGTICKKPSIPTIFCLLGGGNAETLSGFGKIVEVTAD